MAKELLHALGVFYFQTPTSESEKVWRRSCSSRLQMLARSTEVERTPETGE